MSRVRIAWVVSLLSLSAAAISFIYLALVLLTRPLHSGITPDIVAGIGVMFLGTLIGQACRLLWRHWRADFLGREARVTRVLPSSTARVWVGGVPCWVFVKDPIHEGDRVTLVSTDLEGAPLRVDFVAQKTPAAGVLRMSAQAR